MPPGGMSPPAGDGMPNCEMYLDAESLNHVSGASTLGWRGGSALLGCIADNDSRGRILLVANNGESLLIADLVALPGTRPGELPRAPQGHLPRR